MLSIIIDLFLGLQFCKSSDIRMFIVETLVKYIVDLYNHFMVDIRVFKPNESQYVYHVSEDRAIKSLSQKARRP
jgi:hypothetical protein